MGILEDKIKRWPKTFFFFFGKIEIWHVGLSCQYTHSISFSSKSEHDTVADQATLMLVVRPYTSTTKRITQYFCLTINIGEFEEGLRNVDTLGKTKTLVSFGVKFNILGVCD